MARSAMIFSVVASFTLMDAELSKLEDESALNGNRPPNVPKVQANVFFDYRVPVVEGLNANLGVFLCRGA